MASLLNKKSIFIGALLTIIIATSGVALWIHKTHTTNPDHITEEHITLNQNEKRGNNEKLHVVHAENPQKGLLIYIANQSHSKQTTEYAKRFASLSYYVAVVDNDLLLSSPNNNTAEHCLDIAQKLIELSAQLQSHYELDNDELPILVGTDVSSATLYAALAQAETHKFHAAVSINFVPQLKTHGQLCQQQAFSTTENQQLKLSVVKRLPTSFYVFQDKSVTPESIKFAEKIGNLKLTIANDVQQSAQIEAIQILQWLDPRLADQISSYTSDSDLPLIEVPVSQDIINEDSIRVSENENAEDKATGNKISNNESQSGITSNTTNSLAIILTGDGGWAEIDKNIANILADKGIPTVALDSLSYFWKARTPEETAQDVENIILQYLKKWNKKNVILIGYSFGADVLPFVANNLTSEVQQKISLVALLGMGKTAAFEFRLSSWMNADKDPNRLPIMPEISKMKWANSVCIYGVNDDAANCLPTAELGVKIISMPGDHHFDEKYDELVQHIIENQKPN